MTLTPNNILVTGGCGFIGSGFVNYIAKRYPQATIVNYDKLILKSDALNVEENIRKSDKYHLVTGDICNHRLVRETLEKYEIDTIVHFAADCTSTLCYSNPEGACRNNITSFVTFMDVCRQHAPLRRFVHVSTDEIYGDSEMGDDAKPMNETDLPKPTNPYAASKAAGESFVNSYRMSYSMPIVTVRMNNIYGPNQWDVKLMPKFIKLAFHEEEFTIQGSGFQLRSWLYITDAAEGICRVVEDGRLGETYNIGTAFELSVKQVSERIQDEVDRQLGRTLKKTVEKVIEDRPYNDQRYLLDTSKIETELGWAPKVSFEDGLKTTVASSIAKLQSPHKPYSEKVLLYGARGWIGTQLQTVLTSMNVSFVIACRRVGDDSDADVIAELIAAQPTHVLCCTGRTHGEGCNTIDYLERATSAKENVRDNLYSVVRLAQLCDELGMHMTYIGTAYVVDSYPDLDKGQVAPIVIGPDAQANFDGNQYSMMKGFTERLLQPYLRNTLLNIRINMPINFDMKSDRNLLAKIMHYPKLYDISCSFSVLPDVLPAIITLLSDRHTGTVNMVNPGTISLHQLRLLVNGNDVVDWERISPENAVEACKKKPMVVLNDEFVKKKFPEIREIGESVKHGLGQ